jgi:outer membrane lipoprotein SlyB
LGAGSGAIIGAAVGHPWAGAAISSPIGLVTGGVIGDSLMGLEHREQRLRAQLSRQSRQLAHQRSEIRQLQAQADTE